MAGSAGHAGTRVSAIRDAHGDLLPYGQMLNDPLDGPHPGIAHHLGKPMAFSHNSPDTLTHPCLS